MEEEWDIQLGMEGCLRGRFHLSRRRDMGVEGGMDLTAGPGCIRRIKVMLAGEGSGA